MSLLAALVLSVLVTVGIVAHHQQAQKPLVLPSPTLQACQNASHTNYQYELSCKTSKNSTKRKSS